MEKSIVIIGAGGQGKVCSEIARLNGYDNIVALDDAGDKYTGVSGKVEDFRRYLSDHVFFVAVGNNAVRQRITELITAEKGTLAVLIHPAATVSPDAIVKTGSVVMAGAVINPGAKVGDGAIINTCSSLDHDNRIGAFAHVGVGAHLAGAVIIGDRSFIGAGTTVINNISICEDCIIGAGAVVVSVIKEQGTYVGVPAKR